MIDHAPRTAAEAPEASRSPAPMLTALVGYSVAFCVALFAWQLGDAQRSAAAMESMGTALSDDVARLAVDPMVGQDTIQLGLIARRIVERPEVARVAIYSSDDRPLVDVGASPGPDAPMSVRRIAVEEDSELVGFVRVTMDEAAFRLPPGQLVLASWPLWIAGLAATIVVVLCRDLLARGLQRLFAPALSLFTVRTPSPAREEVFLLVASLSHADAMASYARDRVLRRSMEAADRVADLYAGQVVELPGAGIALAFNDAEADDRAFEAVCAALLVRRLLDDLQRLGEFAAESPSVVGGNVDGPAALFSYGLDLASREVDADDPEAFGEDGEAVRDIARLSILAPTTGVVIAQSAFATVEGVERLQVDEIGVSGVALPATGPIPGGVVRDAAGEYQGLLAQQAEAIAAAMR